MIKLFSLISFYTVFLTSVLIAQSGWFQLSSGTLFDLNAVSFFDMNTGMAVGSAGIILKTTNGGTSWIQQPSGTTAELFDIILINNNTAFVTGSGGNILKTTDGGSSWNPISSGVSDNLYSISINGSFGLIGGSSQTILVSTNGGDSWSVSQTGFFGGGFWGTSAINTTTGFVAGENSIFQPLAAKTTDNGGNWNFTAFYLNANEGRLQDCYFFDSNSGIAAASVWTGQGAISRTSDGGTNWNSTLYSDALFGLDFPTTAIGYAVGYNGIILKSTNAGILWLTQTSNTSAWLKDVDFVNPFIGFAVGESGTIMKTTDGGIIPVELTSFSASISGNSVILNWSTSTETNNSGFEIERKSSFTDLWKKIGYVEGNGTTTQQHSYAYTDNILTPGIYQYRLKQIDFDGSFEYSYSIEAVTEPPVDYSLDQNYPNPFNPNTVINFRIPISGHVNVTVYDIIGNEVAKLVNEFKSAGNYEIEFDGSGLSSGIYLYELKADDFILTRKMTLVK